MTNLLRTAAPYAIALSIAYLATVILLWRAELQRLDTIVDEVGQIVDEVEQWRKLVPDMLAQVEQTRAEIAPILAESEALRQQLPPVLAEVAASRQLGESALNESAQLRAALPAILEEVAAVRETLPSVTAESAQWRQTVPLITREVAAVRELTPQILDEVGATREAMPVLMDRAEDLIAAAEVAGRNASKGAVTGVFTGLITAPFSIMRNVSSSLFGTSELSEEDMKLLRQSGYEVLNAGVVGAKDSWRNRRTDVRGRTELLQINAEQDGECRTLRFEAEKNNQSLFNKNLDICRSGQGEWEVQAD